MIPFFLAFSLVVAQIFPSPAQATSEFVQDEFNTKASSELKQSGSSPSAESGHNTSQDTSPITASAADESADLTFTSTSEVRNHPIEMRTREEFCSLLMSAAKENSLPVSFFLNLIWQESKFDRTAVSSAGAMGVAQFMPPVARRLGVRNPFDPREALPASARLLNGLHSQFGNLGLAAAAYNAGPKRVIDWLAKRSRLPRETRNYVLVITGRPPEHWVTKAPRVDVPMSARAPCAHVESVKTIERAAASNIVSASKARRVNEAKVSSAIAADYPEMRTGDAHTSAKATSPAEEQSRSSDLFAGAELIRLGPEERVLIRTVIMRDHIAWRQAECRIKERTPYTIGRPFPRITRVCPFPDEVRASVADAWRYRYLVAGNEIVLIDPQKRHRIVAVVE